MRIRLTQLHLKNFKAFDEISISPNESFNIIIGENSAGKSTIFEAIQLWEKCYSAYIQASKKKFYQTGGNHRYINYQELDFLRITDDNDLFHHGRARGAEVSLTLKIDDEEYKLGFKVSTPSSISNAFFRVNPIFFEDFIRFAEKIVENNKTLDEAVFIYQTRPVAGVLQYEPYLNEGQVTKKIQKGLSHEVLRNKIIAKRDSLQQLEEAISDILDKQVKFDLPPRTRARTDEYVSIKVSIGGGKKQDLHLQGSGFLQIAEILSTVEFLEAPLKLLLVDEPDSHIHTKLQGNLIKHLRGIDDNQFFIISHNDQFVTNAGEGEVFFLSDEAKSEKLLPPIATASFDTIKRALGGVILSLEQLNQAKHIAFVEGTDDAEYLKNINSKLKEITQVSGCLKDVTFFPLRGKDNIAQKIEYNKRTLSSMLRGKTWNAIFDRDFSTDVIDTNLKSLIQGKGCTPFSHNGYCIESVLFSDMPILQRFICSLVDYLPHADVNQLIASIVRDDIETAICDVNSELNQTVQGRFNSQKRNRPEFEDLEYADVMRSWRRSGVFQTSLVMSKPLIKEFVLKLEENLGRSLFLRSSNDDEEISSKLFLAYVDYLDDIENLYPSLTDLFTQLGVLAEAEDNAAEEDAA